jgi:hypothetical protein
MCFRVTPSVPPDVAARSLWQSLLRLSFGRARAFAFLSAPPHPGKRRHKYPDWKAAGIGYTDPPRQRRTHGSSLALSLPVVDMVSKVRVSCVQVHRPRTLRDYDSPGVIPRRGDRNMLPNVERVRVGTTGENVARTRVPGACHKYRLGHSRADAMAQHTHPCKRLERSQSRLPSGNRCHLSSGLGRVV